jgi:HPt (histidine-containing phosphotransfer) domain-containing protein
MSDYSLKKLAFKIDFDEDDYIPLLELFIETTASNLSSIAFALGSGDNESISSNLHNIKGASLNLGLDKISEIVASMDKLNKAGLFTDIKKRIEDCNSELNDLKEVLEKNNAKNSCS